jgi:hypothetical protein
MPICNAPWPIAGPIGPEAAIAIWGARNAYKPALTAS